MHRTPTTQRPLSAHKHRLCLSGIPLPHCVAGPEDMMGGTRRIDEAVHVQTTPPVLMDYADVSARGKHNVTDRLPTECVSQARASLC